MTNSTCMNKDSVIAILNQFTHSVTRLKLVFKTIHVWSYLFYFFVIYKYMNVIFNCLSYEVMLLDDSGAMHHVCGLYMPGI